MPSLKQPTAAESAVTNASKAVAATADLAYRTGGLPRRDGAVQPIEPAGLDQAAAAALRDLAASCNAVRTIETGLGLGLSALALGEAILSTGDASALHTAIDPAVDWAGYAGLDLVLNSAMAPHFRHFNEWSQLALPRLVSQGERFDFALVDGGHQFDVALMDIFYMMMLVPPGGVVAVDDPWMPAVRLAIEFAVTNLDCELTKSPISRFAVLRRPDRFPPRRAWDHFVPFADPGPEKYDF